MEIASITTENKPLTSDDFRRTLIRTVRTELPDFRFLTFATGVYYFQRVRDFYDLDLKEIIHIVFDQAEGTMRCSISSRLNPIYTLSPFYSNSVLNPHVDLIAIKRGYTILPTEGALYRCDGTLFGAREMLDEVITDLKTAGLRYLDTRLENLWLNQAVRRGLDIIDGWEVDRIMLKNELVQRLRSSKNKPARILHPATKFVRETLMALPHQSIQMKKQIPMLTFELMELYCRVRIVL